MRSYILFIIIIIIITIIIIIIIIIIITTSSNSHSAGEPQHYELGQRVWNENNLSVLKYT